MAENYLLRVTAGPSYDPATHHEVSVNAAEPLHISSDVCDLDLNVRVQSYRGLPKNSPETSTYFDIDPHPKNNDQYSIAFRFKPKKTISGDELVFGNDFDHPIRDRLPPGFNIAFRIVKWAIDPGLDGDVYADKPYLYGPAGSSFNALYVGSKAEGGLGENSFLKDDAGMVITEGGHEGGLTVREEKGVPSDEASRKKWFLTEANRKSWEWEAGREYAIDFYNPYLDFNRFALNLPGFKLPIMKYWDGQSLRYVLKNKKTDEVVFVLLFTLLLKDDVNEDGSVKARAFEHMGKPHDEAIAAGQGTESAESSSGSGKSGDDEVD